MFSSEYFYHGSIRRYTIMFGSLFNNIQICDFENSNIGESVDLKFIKVPLRYGGGVVYSRSTGQESRKQKTVVLPHMSYKLADIDPDGDRKTNKYEKITNENLDSITPLNKTLTYGRTPYNFSYSLIIRTKTTDDMLQIIEQIIPHFDPSITLEIKDLHDQTKAYKDKTVEPKQMISVTLDNIGMDETDNTLEESRYVEWELTFTVKGYLYREVLDTPYITSVKRDFILQNYNLLTEDLT